MNGTTSRPAKEAALHAPDASAGAPVRDHLLDSVDEAVAISAAALRALQARDGHFVFPLEADATIPAEYILLHHYLDTVEPEIESRLANYLRRTQSADGSWPLFAAGDGDISATVKAYYALKLVGDAPELPHMARTREWVLSRGGAARVNVFTRVALALFGQVPWRAVPAMPVEIMLLPRWFPFHIEKISYWSRTVLVPLLVLMALKPRARNPRGIGVAELFLQPAETERRYLVNPTGRWPGRLLLWIDAALRRAEPLLPKAPRQRAIARARDFVTERLNGLDGLGGIFPAMANAAMMHDALGAGRDDPTLRTCLDAIDRMLHFSGDEAFCQPCLSPVWDTALALHALHEAGEAADGPAVTAARDWLLSCQILDVRGDWASTRPGLVPGGWAFQYANPYYPDTDDTAAVALVLHRVGGPGVDRSVARATDWIIGMQSSDGGWGAFDAENTYSYLDHIPFADHGALLDPPSADVSARCISLLGQVGIGRDRPAMKRGLDYLRAEQEADGSWFGRWGTNYIYGTWSALSALSAAGEDMNAPHIRRAVAWLDERQRGDGGWGESCASYWPDHCDAATQSTPTHTAWALLALMAAGEVRSAAVERGIGHLLACRGEDGLWRDSLYNAVGFPRVFFLKYHGYARYFPLWALARYANLRRANDRVQRYGL